MSSFSVKLRDCFCDSIPHQRLSRSQGTSLCLPEPGSPPSRFIEVISPYRSSWNVQKKMTHEKLDRLICSTYLSSAPWYLEALLHLGKEHSSSCSTIKSKEMVLSSMAQLLQMSDWSVSSKRSSSPETRSLTWYLGFVLPVGPSFQFLVWVFSATNV